MADEPWLAYQRQNLPVPAAASEPGPWQEFQLKAGPAKPMEPINPNREALAPTRAMVGLKSSGEGKAGYLESKFGKGNVATDPAGNFYLREPGREWYPLDSASTNLRDVFDLSGAATAAIPAAGALGAAARAGGLVRGLAVGAGGGAAGSVAQQAAGALTPGGDPMSLGDRAGQLGMDAAAGVAGEGVGRGVAALTGAVSPTNILARTTGRADTPLAQEGQQIEQFLGESLTPGQLSQSRGLLTIEGALRRSPTRAAEVMGGKDTRLLTAARKKFDDLTTRMHARPQDAEAYGWQVSRAFDETLNAATKLRRNQAKADFAAVDSAAGRNPVFDTPNTVAALDELISRYETPGGGDATASLARRLRGVRDAMTGRRSALDMQRLLEVYGEGARGTGKPFADLETAQTRMLSGQVLRALESDLDAAAPTAQGPLAASLQAARANYRTNSQAIDELRLSSIGKYLGAQDPASVTPELVAERIMTMRPSQVRQTVVMLGRADPELAQATKRAALERAMLRAEPNEEQIAQRLGQGTTPEEYSPARLLANLQKSPVLEMLDRNERFGLVMLTRSMERLANRANSEGSPTAPLTFAYEIIKGLGSSIAGLQPAMAVKTLATALAPGRLADVIANRQAGQALIRLTSMRPATREATAAMATLAGFVGTRSIQGGEDVRPIEPALRSPVP